MKKFVVMYHAPAEAMEKMMDISPEEAKKGMEPWMAWAAKSGSGLVDLGTPLANGQRLTKSGSAPSERQVSGYSILQAEDMESAKNMLEGHPHLEWIDGCEIEVHETFPMPQ